MEGEKNKKMKWNYDPPVLVKKVFSNFQWNSEIPKVLLTFDDGPNSNTTEKILKELVNNKVNAVFFCVGENLGKYTSIASEIISLNHTLGNHTFKHQRITQQNPEEIKKSIKLLQDLALEKLHYKINYFRPPHGRFDFRSNKILTKFKLRNVMWSLLTMDYQNDLNIVKFAVTKYLSQNSIIVLHDSNKSKNIIVDSIKIILDEVEKRNYQIGKPSECLKQFS